MEGFAVTVGENGLHRVACKDCGQVRHAVGGDDAIQAVRDEHACGPGYWHENRATGESRTWMDLRRVRES